MKNTANLVVAGRLTRRTVVARRCFADLRRTAKACPGLPACITSLIASGAKSGDGDKNRPFFLAIVAGPASGIAGPSADAGLSAGLTGRRCQCRLDGQQGRICETGSRDQYGHDPYRR